MALLKKYKGIFCSLIIGALCVVGAYSLLSSITPSLSLSLSSSSGRLILRLSNTGNQKVRVDSLGMEYFVLYPSNDSTTYTVFVQDRQPASTRERIFRESRLTDLQPGEHVDIDGVSALLKGMPRGNATLRAVYSASPTPIFSGGWSGGAIRSPLLPVNIQ